MLSPKAAFVLSAAVGMLVVTVVFHVFGAVVLGTALLLLFAVNALFALPLRMDGNLGFGAGRVHEDSTLCTTLSLTNPGKRMAVFEYRLDVPATFLPEGAGGTGRMALRPGQREAWEVPTRPLLLGNHRVGPLRIRVSDPSGFRHTEYVAAPPRPVLVYPRVIPLKVVPLHPPREVSFFGTNEISQPGDGFEFFTLRGYQPGDPIRSINWRASARSSGLVVNQRQRESYLTVNVVMDATAHSAEGRALQSPFAVGARSVASLAAFLLRRRDHVRFHLVTDEIRTIQPQFAGRQLTSILEALAGARPQGTMEWASVVHRLLPTFRPGSPVILVSSFETDPTIIDAVRGLAARSHGLLAVSAPSVWPEAMASSWGINARRNLRTMVLAELKAVGGAVVDIRAGSDLPAALQAVMIEWGR